MSYPMICARPASLIVAVCNVKRQTVIRCAMELFTLVTPVRLWLLSGNPNKTCKVWTLGCQSVHF